MKILEEKMTVITYVFRTLRTAKDVLRKMSKMPGFRAPFHSQPAKGSHTLLKSARYRSITFPHRKMSLLLISEILA